jgi:hypothetical protein
VDLAAWTSLAERQVPLREWTAPAPQPFLDDLKVFVTRPHAVGVELQCRHDQGRGALPVPQCHIVNRAVGVVASAAGREFEPRLQRREPDGSWRTLMGMSCGNRLLDEGWPSGRVLLRPGQSAAPLAPDFGWTLPPSRGRHRWVVDYVKLEGDMGLRPHAAGAGSGVYARYRLTHEFDVP